MLQLFMSSQLRVPGLRQLPATQTSTPLQYTPSPPQSLSNSHAGASLHPTRG
jgi:hypothetical protein